MDSDQIAKEKINMTRVFNHIVQSEVHIPAIYPCDQTKLKKYDFCNILFTISISMHSNLSDFTVKQDVGPVHL